MGGFLQVGCLRIALLVYSRAATERRPNLGFEIASIGPHKMFGFGTSIPLVRKQMQICIHHRLHGRHEAVVGGRSTRGAVCRSELGNAEENVFANLNHRKRESILSR